MRSLAITGVAVLLMLAPEAATAQSDSRVGAPPIVSAPAVPMATARSVPVTRTLPSDPRPALSAAPAGPGSYVRPYYGYALPEYWVSPAYYIADYRAYGLARPAPGFGWSRYYDDVVLTDRWGRVYDWRENLDWMPSDRWRGGRDDRGNEGLAGAAVGAVVGGVAGNLIAGRGNRLAGTLIGGGVGALAGQAIDKAETRRRRNRDRWDDDGYRDDGRVTGPHWFGRDADGRYADGYSCACGYAPAAVTSPQRTIVTRTVTYTTDYVRVPAKSARTRLTSKPRKH